MLLSRAGFYFFISLSLLNTWLYKLIQSIQKKRKLQSYYLHSVEYKVALGDKGEKMNHSRLKSYAKRMVSTFSEIPPVFLVERISLSLYNRNILLFLCRL